MNPVYAAAGESRSADPCACHGLVFLYFSSKGTLAMVLLPMPCISSHNNPATEENCHVPPCPSVSKFIVLMQLTGVLVSLWCVDSLGRRPLMVTWLNPSSIPK